MSYEEFSELLDTMSKEGSMKMNVTKLKPPKETKEFYTFSEVIDVFETNPNAAFTCEDYEDEYIAFGNEDKNSGVLCFFSGGGVKILSEKDGVVRMKVVHSATEDPLIVTADVFSRHWKPVIFEKTYNLEVTYDFEFDESSVVEAFGSGFSDLTLDEKNDFLYNLLEDVIEDTPQFLIDGVDYTKV